MNADEVVMNTVAGLRVMSESGDWSVDRQTCTDAASLIESLQSQLAASQRRESAAVVLLQTIDWVGTGAKGRIEDAIGILTGRGHGEKKEAHHDD